MERKRAETTFIISQATLAIIALCSQWIEIGSSSSTKGITIAMFICLGCFNLLNAGFSFAIWKPLRKQSGPIIFSDSEKEARAGCVTYGVSALLYSIIILRCMWKRYFHEDVAVFQSEDIRIFWIFICIIIVLYFMMKTSGVKDPFNNPRIAGCIGFTAAMVAQISSGFRILHQGTSGVPEIALWASLFLIFSKIAYYLFIRSQSNGDDDKKAKADGVLIGEAGNLISWVFVLATFYYKH